MDKLPSNQGPLAQDAITKHQKMLQTQAIPLKLPTDLRELVHNIHSLDDVEQRVNRYFDALEEQMDAVG